MTLQEYADWFDLHCFYMDWVHRHLLGMELPQVLQIKRFIISSVYFTAGMTDMEPTGQDDLISKKTLEIIRMPNYKADPKIKTLISMAVNKWHWGLGNMGEKLTHQNLDLIIEGASNYLYNVKAKDCNYLITKYMHKHFCIYN